MTKVLYIGHYREASGWGEAARNYILALDHVGVDVVCRPVKLNDVQPELPKRILELENKHVQGAEVCIQHVLPHHMVYNGHFKKNIGFFVMETSGIKLTSWPAHINLLDEIWVPTDDMLLQMKPNDIHVPVNVVPHTFDTNVYDLKYEKLNIPDTEEHFLFYFIGDYNRRKHLSALIRAFHAEFDPNEPVDLVLKVGKFGIHPYQLGDEVNKLCLSIKEKMKYGRYYPFKEEIIISHSISRQDILKLHATCDCLVSPSFGEGWNIPAFEAMALGKMPICTDVGAPAEYIDHQKSGFLVKGFHEPVFGHDDTFPEFGSSRERWVNISIGELQKTMRDATRFRMSESTGREKAEEYSWDNIGVLMEDLINA